MHKHIAFQPVRRRKVGAALVALLLAGLIDAPALAAANADNNAAARELRVGFVPGPYADEFRAGVEPQLRRKGYTVRYVEFSTGLEANQAVYRGEIVADVMQHEVYLKS